MDEELSFLPYSSLSFLLYTLPGALSSLCAILQVWQLTNASEFALKDRATTPHDESHRRHQSVSEKSWLLMCSVWVLAIPFAKNDVPNIKLCYRFHVLWPFPPLLSLLLNLLLLFHCWCMCASLATSHWGWNVVSSMNRFSQPPSSFLSGLPWLSYTGNREHFDWQLDLPPKVALMWTPEERCKKICFGRSSAEIINPTQQTKRSSWTVIAGGCGWCDSLGCEICD